MTFMRIWIEQTETRTTNRHGDYCFQHTISVQDKDNRISFRTGDVEFALREALRLVDENEDGGEVLDYISAPGQLILRKGHNI